MVVALHIYKLLQSSLKFIKIMTSNSEMIRSIDCLTPFRDQLTVSVVPCSTSSNRVVYILCMALVCLVLILLAVF